MKNITLFLMTAIIAVMLSGCNKHEDYTSDQMPDLYQTRWEGKLIHTKYGVEKEYAVLIEFRDKFDHGMKYSITSSDGSVNYNKMGSYEQNKGWKYIYLATDDGILCDGNYWVLPHAESKLRMENRDAGQSILLDLNKLN